MAAMCRGAISRGTTGPQRAVICGEPSGMLVSTMAADSMELDHQDEPAKDGYAQAPYLFKPLAAILEIAMRSQ